MDFQYQYSNFEKIDELKVKKWIKLVIRKENHSLEHLKIIFTDQARIRKINREYLNHDYYTDIITFDSSFLKRIKGEIFICPEIVEYNANMLKIKFINELHRVIIHGVLHLLGYNDSSDEEKNLMRRKEDDYLCYFD